MQLTHKLYQNKRTKQLTSKPKTVLNMNISKYDYEFVISICNMKTKQLERDINREKKKTVYRLQLAM